MADTVRYLMEEMVPELEDFQRKKYFSKAEIKQIIAKRQDFEYLLKRKAALKQDFLRYIEYESKLEELRKHRRQALDLKDKKTLADYALVRRIHFIFERATRKFKSDLSLWTRWLEFCRSSSSAKQLSKVVTKAVQVHPTAAGLWVYAAAWELEHNGNAGAARALLQQGLRMCKGSQQLWAEYLRMELLYVHKLRSRRKVLGLDCPDAAPAASAAGVQQEAEEAEQQQEAVEEQDVEEQDVEQNATSAAVRAVLTGAVAGVVYKNAVAAIPGDLGFRAELLKVTQQFKFPGVAQLQDTMYSGIAQDFPQDPQAWDMLARRHCEPSSSDSSSAREQGFPQAVQVYQQGLEATGGSGAMSLLYAAFLTARLEALLAGGDEQQVQQAAQLAQQLFKLYQEATEGAAEQQAQQAQQQQQQQQAQQQQQQEQLFSAWVQLALKLKQPKVALKAARRACSKLPSSAAAWRQRLQLELQLRASRQAPSTQLHDAIKAALAAVPLVDAPALWLLALEALQGSAEDLAELQQLLLRLQSGQARGPVEGGMGAVAAGFVRVLHETQGLEAARALVQQLLKVPPTGGEFFRAAIQLEEQQLEAEPPATGAGAAKQGMRVKELYEAAVGSYGEVDEALWLGFAQAEQRAGRSAGQVYWRATRTLADPSGFIMQYREVVGLV